MIKESVEIIIFTGSYPYSKWEEYAFLQHEIQHLSNKFKKLTIVPSTTEGYMYDIPKNIVIEESFSKIYNIHRNYLIHEYRPPGLGWGVMCGDVLNPCYHYHPDNDTFNLAYPIDFFFDRTNHILDNLKIYLNEKGLDPYNIEILPDTQAW